MKQVLVYADSLTWGIIPNSRDRFPFDQRWPGVMEHALEEMGVRVRVIEDCLNGRRTVLEDPIKPGRNGLIGIGQRIEAHSPLSLVILMLGINDFQRFHDFDVQQSAKGLSQLITAIRAAPVEPGMPIPNILVVAPPEIQEPKGDIADKFAGAAEKCVGVSNAYQQIAVERDCAFLDAGKVTPLSKKDGVHLDADQHQLLGQAIAYCVSALLQNE